MKTLLWLIIVCMSYFSICSASDSTVLVPKLPQVMKCPDGYVLTHIKKPNKSTFACRKLANEWVDVGISGIRG